MSMSKAVTACIALICLGLACPVGAAELELVATKVLRCVNPSDARDVRYLCRFELPASLAGKDIVRAYLRVATSASQSMSVAVSPLEANWLATDTWSTLSAELVNSEGFVHPDRSAHVVSNDIDDVGGSLEDLGLLVPVSEYVRSWLVSGNNFGLCLRRLANDNSDAGQLIESDLPPPVLWVTYDD